jgi:hypothetical protein
MYQRWDLMGSVGPLITPHSGKCYVHLRTGGDQVTRHESVKPLNLFVFCLALLMCYLEDVKQIPDFMKYNFCRHSAKV